MKKITRNRPWKVVSQLNEYVKLMLRIRVWEAGGFIEFDGANCDGPCAGWDGESRRCDCGNRLVAWDNGHYDNDYRNNPDYWYAVAW
jgi:hypothetical protein